MVQVCGQEVDEVLYPNSKRIRATKCPERQNSLDWISFSPHLSTSIIINYYHKKDQKLRKNNGVNNTRKKNLTFLTVLGLSKKKKPRKRKKEIKEEKPKRYIIPPEYYPCTTPLWTCMFLIVLVSILFGELNSVEIEFSHWTPILNFIMVWIRTRNKCAVFICQPKILARIPSNRVLDFFWWLGGLYEVGCESW